MWDSSYNKTTKSCTAFHKKKTDLLSVEYRNYIRRDVLNYLDQYPMKKSSNKPKKGSPNSRNRLYITKAIHAPPKPSPSQGVKSIEGQNPKRNATRLSCSIGPICKCADKAVVEFTTIPANLKLPVPLGKILATPATASTNTRKSSGYSKSETPRESKSNLTDSPCSTLSIEFDNKSKEFYDTVAYARKDSSITAEHIDEITEYPSKNLQPSFCQNFPPCAETAIDNSSELKKYVPPWRIYKVNHKILTKCASDIPGVLTRYDIF